MVSLSVLASCWTATIAFGARLDQQSFCSLSGTRVVLGKLGSLLMPDSLPREQRGALSAGRSVRSPALPLSGLARTAGDKGGRQGRVVLEAVEGITGEEGGDVGGGFVRELFRGGVRGDVGGERAVAMGEHGLGEAFSLGLCGDAEVSEHGVGFPAAEQFDDVGLDISAEESRRPAGPEAAGADESGFDPGNGFEGASGVAESVSDPDAVDLPCASGIEERGDG